MGTEVSGMAKTHKRLATWAILCLFVLALVAANVAAQLADDKLGLAIDLSGDSLTDLSARTRGLLDDLTQDIRITLAQKTGGDTELKALTTEYMDALGAASDRVHVEVVDPDLKPYVIAELDPTGGTVSENTFYVSTMDGSRVRKVDSSQLLYQRTLDGTVYRLFCADARFSGALEWLLDDTPRRAWFLSGHGELAMDECATLSLALAAQGYEVAALTLGAQQPQSSELVMILSPQTDLLSSEVTTLKRFIDGGGHLLAAYGADTPQSKLGQLDMLLDLYGVGFEQGVVVEGLDESERYVDRPDLLCPQPQDESAVTASLTQRLLLPEAVAIRAPRLVSGMTTTKLLCTSQSAYRKLAPDTDRYAFASGDISGRQTLALAADSLSDDGARLLLIGSADIFKDDVAITGGSLMDASGNLELLLACVAHLSGEEPSQDTVDLKVVPTNLITFPSEREQERVMLIGVAALPLALLVIGTVVLLIRRRRGC